MKKRYPIIQNSPISISDSMGAYFQKIHYAHLHDALHLARSAIADQQEYYCRGPVSNTAIESEKRYIYVPALSEGESLSVLREISEQTAANLDSSFYLPLKAIGGAMNHPNEIRNKYVSSLAEARKAWVSDGKVVTEKVAKELSALRVVIRNAARAQGNVPTFAYELIDRYGSKYRGTSYQAALARADYASAINASFSDGSRFTKGTKILSSAGKALARGSAVLMVADISASAASVYLAKNQEQQQKALTSLGEDLGATAGVYSGMKICAALTVATGGLALLGCAIAPLAGYYLGSRAGSLIVGGDAANKIVNTIRAEL